MVATTENRYAAPVPIPISVHILGLRLTTDAQARLKNGAAAQTTTGVARISSAHLATVSPSQSRTGNPTIGPMATIRMGIVSAAETLSRKEKSTSSGFGPSSAAGTPIGSSAIPHLGQSPGASVTISGCMGQVYFVPSGMGSGAGRSPSQASGSAANLSLHLRLQKK